MWIICSENVCDVKILSGNNILKTILFAENKSDRINESESLSTNEP